MSFTIATLAFLGFPLSKIVLYVIGIEGGGQAADGDTLRGNSSNTTADVQSLPILIDRIFDLLVPLQEAPCPNGGRRAKRTCQCGTRLFDDFAEIQQSAIDSLEAKLQQRASISVFEALKQVWELLLALVKSLLLRFTL
ncbi:hypothetical protein F5Y13DRAFT_190469 [Hypoxylon sp. FL1857]|nr:hypothetical protein F5Y13DRAFT_190469 [Hypoxylon sp. FL1857]